MLNLKAMNEERYLSIKNRGIHGEEIQLIKNLEEQAKQPLFYHSYPKYIIYWSN
jgi:hypothetical protein